MSLLEERTAQKMLTMKELLVIGRVTIEMCTRQQQANTTDTPIIATCDQVTGSGNLMKEMDDNNDDKRYQYL